MKFPPAPPVDAVKFCDFVTASPTPFHAVHNLSQRLLSAGFTPLSERALAASSLAPGGRYFYTRNQSSIVAFTLPAAPSPSTAIAFAVGHVDSPCLKVRPVSKRSKLGYLQVGVELYGGGIWHSWFDRDLSLAGRVIVATPGTAGAGFTSRLVKIDRPLLRLPTLAIHLDRTANDNFKFNKETEFIPIAGIAADTLNAPAAGREDGEDGAEASGGGAAAGGAGASRPMSPIPFSGAPSRAGTPLRMEVDSAGADDVAGMAAKHHPLLLAVLADELGCAIADIQDFELSLYDTQPSTVGGLSNEFIFSPRIDNLMTSFASVEGLAQAVEAETALGRSTCESVRCVILFDNEEVGSVSHHGAESNLLPAFAELVTSLPGYGPYYATLANSFLVSADMGHAVNPNYSDRYEANHAPRINGGVVIKTNANQRYTSNAQTTFLLRRVAKRAGVPVQEFEIRNDSACGSTVGPHLSTHVRTVDIGLAQLSMHSIRETAGSADVKDYIKLFKTYFDVLAEVERDLKID